MILQPPSRYGHYGQACRTRYSTEPSYEPPLHYYYPAISLVLPPHLRPSSQIDPLHLILQVILQALRISFWLSGAYLVPRWPYRAKRPL